MAERIEVVRRQGLEAGPSTAGIVRSQAFATDGLWIGEVRTEPGAISGWHHHGEHRSCGMVLTGRLRFEFGPGGNEIAEAAPGEFFMVPPHIVHREGNPGGEEQILVVARSGSGPTVINVDGPDPG